MNFTTPRLRKYLSPKALIEQVRLSCENVDEAGNSRSQRAIIPTADALMAAFAMFSLKMESLLTFDQGRQNTNLNSIYHIGRVPCDTQMREILDHVPPQELHPLFTDLFRQVQRGKGLKRFEFWNGHYLLALDGTGHFSSTKIRCPHCLEKTSSKTGKTTYHHQMLAGVLVHPDHREVLPIIAPEPIIKQDGNTKNDCERNAAKRFIERFRHDHPHLKVMVVEDALSSNAPHIETLKEHDIRFLLGVKPGDHAHLFEQFTIANEEDRDETWTVSIPKHGGEASLTVVRDLPLNASHPDLLVNVLDYWEHDAQGKLIVHYSWVTDLPIDASNGYLFSRGGRARWRIENETFNTLKNQGYHFEHNYGHGKQNLCTVLAILMMVAFLVDQILQAFCGLFHEAWDCCHSKRNLWREVRSNFMHFRISSLTHLYLLIASRSTYGMAPPPILDSS